MLRIKTLTLPRDKIGCKNAEENAALVSVRFCRKNNQPVLLLAAFCYTD